MASNRIVGDTHIQGQLSADTMTVSAASVTNDSVSSTAAIARTKLAQDTNQPYKIPWAEFRVWDARQTNLPGTPATDDLGLVGGTWATDSTSIQTEDLKAAGATSNRAWFEFALPPEYDAGQTITCRVHAGMLTTVADAAATVDIECYKSDDEAGIGADLCTTAAQDINSLTLADKDFTITPTGLEAGDRLEFRMTTAINDAATGTEVKGIVGAVEILLDIQG